MNKILGLLWDSIISILFWALYDKLWAEPPPGWSNTYFTLLSNEKDDINLFVKFILECIIDQCNRNIKKIKKLNKIYENDLETFKNVIGGSTIYKVYPFITKKICFTTNDVVKEWKLHINSVNKVLNKLVESGHLTKEKKKGTNRVTFCYNNMLDVFSK